jgi:hypothetical protein
MNAQSYVQTQCPRCGHAAWGHLYQPVACGTCGQPIGPVAQQQAPTPQQAAPMPQPAAPAAQPVSQPQHQVKLQLPYGIKIPLKLGGKNMHLKIIAIVVLGIVVAVAGVILKGKFGGQKTKKGNLSYSSIGIDMKKADPDAMIDAVGAAARKWRSDAVWWSINLQAVKADGTVDASNGGAQVVYISLNGVQSATPSVRNDSMKKFNFGPAGVDHSQLWGATDAWEGVQAHPEPTCGIADVVKILNGQGLEGSKTVRITFDPQFANQYAWHVIGTDPKIDAHYSMVDCSPVK